ncbi:MAG: phospholipase D family protein [Usitatibacteraceae bacterium]
MSTEFLSGVDVLRHIKEQFESASEIVVAVAYWGRGAVKQLELQKHSSKPVTVICNLMSGGCNPDEMRELLKLKGKNWKFLFHNNLHGKVYWTPKSAVIGSSNLSSNGLAYEGLEAAGLVEANLKTSYENDLRKTREWIDHLAAQSHVVDEMLIRQAEVIWKTNRRNRPTQEWRHVS